ncbi:MAG: diaminopimelate decarboxylase [Alphaproteobacteria bacterium]|nr:diaminopimelate decarboxylase [Alphaproteobacteria bacterium]
MDHFAYKEGVLHAEDIALTTLAEEVGTPFYCYSTATLRRHFEVFRTPFDDIDHKICYAVKANSNLAILKVLADCGAGADVVSEGEIRRALAAGIAPENIVFSGVGKTQSEMRFALEQDIFQFNIESEAELLALNAVASEMHTRASIAIRVNPDVDAKTNAKISTGKKENKFGIDIAKAPELYARAAVLTGIKVQGVSVHIGSQLTSVEPFREAFIKVRELVQSLRKSGLRITTIDVGGGLGVPYERKSAAPPSPAQYAAVVKDILSDMDCTLIFEPGRLLVGNAGILVTKVIYVKPSDTRTFAIVDVAMNDLLRPSLYGAHHDIIPVAEPAENIAEVPIDIVGPVCETGDTFAEQRLLPMPASGDLLVFRTAGAYGAVMSSTYNSRHLTPEILVDGEKYGIIRKRQTYDQMLALDAIPSWLA